MVKTRVRLKIVAKKGLPANGLLFLESMSTMANLKAFCYQTTISISKVVDHCTGLCPLEIGHWRHRKARLTGAVKKFKTTRDPCP